MILISFESSETALHSDVFRHAYLTTVTVATCGKPQYHRIRKRILILWAGLRVEHLQQIISLWAKNERLIVKLCVGTLRRVAVYTNRLTAVNMEISALYYIISPNYVLLFPRELTDITQTLQQPSLRFAGTHCENLWDQFSSGMVVFYPSVLVWVVAMSWT